MRKICHHLIFTLSIFIILVLLKSVACAENVTWDDYRKPFQKSFRVRQNKKEPVESVTVIVNLPETFLRNRETIVLVIDIESRTEGDFATFTPFLKANDATFGSYKIPVKDSPNRQTRQVEIKNKHLQAGQNRFKFFYNWKKERSSCSGYGCGYTIHKISFKDAPSPPTPTPKPTATPRPKRTSTPRPPTPTPTPSRVPELLEKAEEYFNKKWFLTPEETNAFDVYKEILSLHPSHKLAKNRILEMMNQYKIWGDNNYDKGDYEKAATYYERYMLIADYVLQTLKDQSIVTEYEEIEARLAQTQNPPTPTPTPTPTPLPTPAPTATPMPLLTATPTPLPTAIPSPTLTPILPATPAESVPETGTPASISTPIALLDLPTEFMQRSTNVYAVIIGIGDYQDEWIPDFRFTETDAAALYQVLIDPDYGAIPEDHIRLVTGQRATDRHLKKILGTWLRQQTTAADYVIIYIAGHGAYEQNEGYWVPYNAQSQDLYSTALSHRKINEMLEHLPAQNILVLLDLCYTIATMAPADRNAVMQTAVPWQDLAQPEYTIMSASDGKQLSLELEVQQQSVFTFTLVEGLQGKADADQDGKIQPAELWQYIEAQLPELAARHDMVQIPQLQGTLEQDVPLAFSLPNLRAYQAKMQREARKEQIRELYQAGNLSEDQLKRALNVIDTEQHDQILEDFFAEKISLDLFQAIF